MQAGASLSHHHGIGLARVDWMAAEHGEGLALLRDIKHLLDPRRRDESRQAAAA
jgi:alkyldihydroxyacetonephosphate synthase